MGFAAGAPLPHMNDRSRFPVCRIQEPGRAMKILLVGVSCVGKTTVGQILACRLKYHFFDLDHEVEKHFGAPIERLQARFMTDYMYRKKAAGVLKTLCDGCQDCVIALPPSGMRDAFLRVIRKLDCLVMAIEDTPDNILARITFYDADSRPIQKKLTAGEKRAYLRLIRKDVAYFGKTYKRADLHVDISGLDAEGAAVKIEKALEEHGLARGGDRGEEMRRR